MLYTCRLNINDPEQVKKCREGMGIIVTGIGN